MGIKCFYWVKAYLFLVNITFSKQVNDFTVFVFKPKESKGDSKDDSGDAPEMEKDPETKQVTGIVHVSKGNCLVFQNQMMC